MQLIWWKFTFTISLVDGLKPIRTVGVYSHRNQSDNPVKRMDQGLSVQ